MATPTSASEWKAKSTGIELELPSGNVCLVKRVGIERILSSGIIPDELTAIAVKTIKAQDHRAPGGEESKSKDLDNAEIASLLKDTDQIATLLGSFDRIAAMCVVQPTLLWHRREAIDPATGQLKRDDKGKPVLEDIPVQDRDADVLYTDDVDMQDKMFIYNFVVGGTADLEQFRKEHGEGLAALQSGQDVAGTPVRPAAPY